MIDPRIDPKMPHLAIVQRVVDIIRENGPIPFTEIFSHLPKTTGLTGSYVSYILMKLKAFGVAQCTRKGYPKFVWLYVPVEGEVGYVPPVAKPVKTKRVMLRHMGSYRVKTHDGRHFDRMEFHRANLTWSNRTVTLEMDEISQVAFVPDHAAYKSGTRHLDIYAHEYSDINDCIIPKLKATDEALPKWVHPIRARALNATVSLPRPEKPLDAIKKDFGDPFL